MSRPVGNFSARDQNNTGAEKHDECEDLKSVRQHNEHSGNSEQKTSAQATLTPRKPAVKQHERQPSGQGHAAHHRGTAQPVPSSAHTAPVTHARVDSATGHTAPVTNTGSTTWTTVTAHGHIPLATAMQASAPAHSSAVQPAMTDQQKTKRPAQVPLLNLPSAEPGKPAATLPALSAKASSPVPTQARAMIPAKDDAVKWSDASQELKDLVHQALTAPKSLSMKDLARAMVLVESMEGKKLLGGDSVARILRGKLVIKGVIHPKTGQKEDIDLMALVAAPLLREQFRNFSLSQLRRRIQDSYRTVAAEVARLHTEIKNDPKNKDLKKNNEKKIAALMDPVIKPALDYLGGEHRTLESSRLSKKMKEFLLELDKQIIQWFVKKGTGRPGDLYEARRQAIAAYLGIRGLMPVWQPKLAAGASAEHAANLSKYLVSSISLKMLDFIDDILINQKDQSVEQRKYVEVLAKARMDDKHSETGLRSRAPAEFRAKTLLSMQNKEAAGISSASSPRLNEHKQRLFEDERARRRYVDTNAKEIIKASPEFFAYFKESVLALSERGYAVFKRDPKAKCLKYFDEFLKTPEGQSSIRKDKEATVRNALAMMIFNNPDLNFPANPFEETSTVTGQTVDDDENVEVVTESSETELSSSAEIDAIQKSTESSEVLTEQSDE